ncbi:RING-box protein 1 [Puccinia graminis f. sp. tritici]|uniref:RING-box protein 1 n=1 Tax=Puccinia graminis f. sp. tritici TaxID=56615 RepID=A0A5B0S8C2_PUCGR|nr:RING-box protein 1 [Puccinia graminis f. sp. tritici]KAA1134108.1 RING-box protein 1 [Puccinia graminis f. sp. tritici]
MADSMDVDQNSVTKPDPEPTSNEQKRFVVKKWNAVALWAWDIIVDNCAICRNHIMDLCKEHIACGHFSILFRSNILIGLIT